MVNRVARNIRSDHDPKTGRTATKVPVTEIITADHADFGDELAPRPPADERLDVVDLANDTLAERRRRRRAA